MSEKEAEEIEEDDEEEEEDEDWEEDEDQFIYNLCWLIVYGDMNWV